MTDAADDDVVLIDPAELAILFKRVGLLETLIGTCDDGRDADDEGRAADQNTSIGGRLWSLKAAMVQIEKKQPAIEDFFLLLKESQVNNNENTISSTSSGYNVRALADIPISNQAKRRILTSASKDVQHAVALHEKIHSLENIVFEQPLPNPPSTAAASPSLEQLQTTHSNQDGELRQQTQAIEELLVKYNDYIAHLSEVFLQLHVAVGRLETEWQEAEKTATTTTTTTTTAAATKAAAAESTTDSGKYPSNSSNNRNKDTERKQPPNKKDSSSSGGRKK